MNFIERVMRVMTHINIGAALGLVAWVLWSGWQVATGHIVPAYTPDEVRTLVRLANAGPSHAHGTRAFECARRSHAAVPPTTARHSASRHGADRSRPVKPEATGPSTRPEGRQRRRVRLFVALHLGAVGAIYAFALIVGGGFQGPPMPPLTGAPANAPASSLVPKQLAPNQPVDTWKPTALPTWVQRAEITRPWESR